VLQYFVDFQIADHRNVKIQIVKIQIVKIQIVKIQIVKIFKFPTLPYPDLTLYPESCQEGVRIESTIFHISTIRKPK
jgi:hypothetical protein